MASELLVQRLLGSLGEAGISSKYDVDDVLIMLETITVFLVVFIIFILFFLWSSCRCRLEGFAQDHAFPHRVVALGMDWASFGVENLIKLIMWFVALLTTRGAIHSADCIIRLALERGIPLVAGASTVVEALPIVVIVAAGEATAFLLLFICPALHHVT